MARLTSEKYVFLKINANIRFIKGPAKAQTASFVNDREWFSLLSILIPNGVKTISFGFSPKIKIADKWPSSWSAAEIMHRIVAFVLSEIPITATTRANKKLMVIFVSLHCIVIYIHHVKGINVFAVNFDYKVEMRSC